MPQNVIRKLKVIYQIKTLISILGDILLSKQNKKDLVFYSDYLYIPRVGLASERVIPYHTIFSFKETNVSGSKVLEIHVNEGRKAVISAKYLSRKEDFKKLISELKEKTGSVEVESVQTLSL